MRGPGFHYSAPAAWRAESTATSASARSAGSRPALVSAVVYRLGKAYTPSEFAAASKELDRVAARLAKAAGGRVVSSETTSVDGHKIRAYRFTAQRKTGGAYEDRVGFLLDGKREVQLLCEAPAGSNDPDGACALLFSSFSLG